MSEQNQLSDEHDLLAAELALGLIEGEELSHALALQDRDAAFAEAAGRWRGRLAHLLDSISPIDPPESLWTRIADRIGTAANDNFTVIHRTMIAWRRAAFAAGALAAALTLAVILRPDAVPQPASQVEVGETLVATLITPENDLQLVATWAPGSGRMKVASSVLPAVDPQAAHELWIIPVAGTTPRSLGVFSGEAGHRIDVPRELADEFEAGATLAISVEPQGGSPTGLPTGPVIATGQLEPV